MGSEDVGLVVWLCVCVCGQKLGENTGKKMQKIPQSRPPGLPWSTQHLKTVSDLAGIVLKMMKLIFQISKWEANLELQCIAFQYFTPKILPGVWVGTWHTNVIWQF